MFGVLRRNYHNYNLSTYVHRKWPNSDLFISRSNAEKRGPSKAANGEVRS